MTWVGFLRGTELGLANFWRNRWLSLAASLGVTLMLFTTSVFLVQSVVIFQTTEAIRDKIDLVIYFTEETSEEQIQTLREAVANRVDVSSVEYFSKERAFQAFQDYPGFEDVKDLVTPEDNPLPRSLEIRATDPVYLDGISTFFDQPAYAPFVRSKSDEDASHRQLIQDLTETARTARRNGLILSGIFLVIAALMVFNTARIIVHARREEISIMRLVGSTSGFIRWPFVIEGLLYGVIGAVLAMGVLYIFLARDLASATPLMSITGALGEDMFSFYQGHFWWILATQLLFGSLVSVLATMAAIWQRIRL